MIEKKIKEIEESLREATKEFIGKHNSVDVIAGFKKSIVNTIMNKVEKPFRIKGNKIFVNSEHPMAYIETIIMLGKLKRNKEYTMIMNGVDVGKLIYKGVKVGEKEVVYDYTIQLKQPVEYVEVSINI